MALLSKVLATFILLLFDRFIFIAAQNGPFVKYNQLRNNDHAKH
jgi:hypothetical protein